MIVTINVTQQDIDEGERGKCGACPVARAINRVLPFNFFTFVHAHTIAIYERGIGLRLATGTTPEAKQFVKDYDSVVVDKRRERFVVPFSFDMDMPFLILKSKGIVTNE